MLHDRWRFYTPVNSKPRVTVKPLLYSNVLVFVMLLLTLKLISWFWSELFVSTCSAIEIGVEDMTLPALRSKSTLSTFMPSHWKVKSWSE